MRHLVKPSRSTLNREAMARTQALDIRLSHAIVRDLQSAIEALGVRGWGFPTGTWDGHLWLVSEDGGQRNPVWLMEDVHVGDTGYIWARRLVPCF